MLGRISAKRASENITQNEQRPQLELPPSRVVHLLVDSFLSTLNSVLPLYNDSTLIETVKLWYSTPSQRTRTAWASINVVMALAQFCGHGLSKESEDFVADCVGKAQSVLTELIMGDPKLDSLQVILGLVLLFQSMPSTRPAALLISTAFRLIHEMGIHRREGYDKVSDMEARQRRRVFWVAYILDRDISMRTRRPPVHEDADTDLDFPPDHPSADEAGFIDAGDGCTRFSFFRARAQLAQIQGQVYDCLFSVQALLRPADECARAVTHLRGLLTHWQMQIPAALRANALMRNSDTTLSKLFCMLHATSLSLLGQLTRVNALEFDWVNKLLRHARNMHAGRPSVPPALLEGWTTIVDEARMFTMLFLSIPQEDVAFGQ